MSERRSAKLNLDELSGRILPGSAVPPISPRSFLASSIQAAQLAQPKPTPAPTPTPPPAATPAPVPTGTGLGRRHYSHIRVAMLAYSGNPVGPVERRLLRESVDLVIPSVNLLQQFDKQAPATPQMIYTNVSNIYLTLHTDWLNYADNRGLDREGAYYHVNKAMPFSGDSGSSRPVNWFWSIQRGSDSSGWRDFTPVTRSSDTTVAFAPAGQSVMLGYPERFREINISVRTAPGTKWSAQLEYSTGRDRDGRPTAWKPLATVSDTTGGARRSGTVTFNPPNDWRTASVDKSEYLYFVRYRTTTVGTPPVMSSLLGRDYVAARGTNRGTIPAFDASADRDRDGYLNDSEYQRRKPGMDARFRYESRLFYPAYGQMRFATNPADRGFRNWSVDYARRFLAQHPRADGLFLDNSFGRLQVDTSKLIESTANYAEDYGTLAGAIDVGIGSKYVLANTAGAGASAAPLIRSGVSYVEEFALRPMRHHWQQFEDMAQMVAERYRLMGPDGMAILDTHPVGGSPTDPRTQIASLAYYYLLADPKRTYVMFNGGYEPSSTWSRHWTEAVKFDVGKPKEEWSEFARGTDPGNPSVGYRVYGREYDRALVLYKPLAYQRGRVGTTADSSATRHQLNGNYRELRADGTLGPVITSIRMRNGEGAILVKAQ